MTETLWMNLNTGQIACFAHAGGYLTSAIAARPTAHHHSTPLGDWACVTAADDTEYTADIGHPMRCETCGATRAA